ncbi:hypothetical protein E2C01_088108 [Portunus trituberculatus]|uniref:Uncharacterized protein n=1 Tax=Portunus trituberculatus TaxID=210409 RepID=A0A5B7JF27_PORTR|nr:hypothetical protein [Portunus trituberculatus]
MNKQRNKNSTPSPKPRHTTTCTSQHVLSTFACAQYLVRRMMTEIPTKAKD